MIVTERTIGVLLEQGVRFLSGKGFENPLAEARALLSGMLDLPPTMLYLDRDKPLNDRQAERYDAMLHRRATHEPVAYILGAKNFFGREFQVNSSTLIPRPETELLVERALARGPAKILDVGTGSGCIAVTMALELPNSRVTAVDISSPALDVAQRNAKRLGAENVRFIQSDLYQALGPGLEGVFDMIIANPPYVPAGEIARLDPDLSFEPVTALAAGIDGLSCIRSLVAGAPRFLAASGRLMFEIGHDQGPAVRKILSDAGFRNVEIALDDDRRDRIASGDWFGSI
jgi:release factor glutamine methyltransferase